MKGISVYALEVQKTFRLAAAANPCGTKNPCAANPCALKVNPCAAAEKNPCAAPKK